MSYANISKRIVLFFCAVTVAMPVFGLEEVTVTARKRTENFKDIPITMNVFNAEEIESAGIERAKDFIALTPNATLVQVQSSGNTFIGVRGITQNRNTEPSVAFLVDGVLQSQPSQFNQELFDIEQIEFLKGPQGALYGRNAIGGAITIVTKKPGDELEGKLLVGGDDGPGYRVQGVLGGPVPAMDNLKFRGAISWLDTDGWIENTFLNEEADKQEDLAGRLKLLWEPTDNFTADFRVSFSQFDGQGFNYRIASTPTADVTCGGTFVGCFDANKILDVRVVNPGHNEKDLTSFSLKLDYETEHGTLTAISAYDDIWEINTGDNYPFLDVTEGGFGSGQSQFFDIQTFAQELRFTSPQDQQFRWALGAYAIWTDRFVSTGSMTNPAQDVFEIPLSPTPSFASGDQATFLSDSQDNFAWALFADMTFDITDNLEAGVSVRYDRDKRENTTETPNAFLTGPLTGVTFQGEVRKDSWSALQPKITVRYHANDDHTLYGSFARGFRSGGFNQAGVGADPLAAFLSIEDTFDEEIADTLELGLKSQWLDGRLQSNVALFYTRATGSYYFRFLADTSTQNLGSLDEVEFKGFEIETSALVTDDLSMYASVGVTDSEIIEAPLLFFTSSVGNKVPYVSDYTLNVGANYQKSLGNLYPGLEGFIRADYSITGETAWEPSNETNRDAYDLLDLRFGLDFEETMTLTFWSRNLLNKQYNIEYSSGGFIYKGQPRQMGVNLEYRF